MGVSYLPLAGGVRRVRGPLAVGDPVPPFDVHDSNGHAWSARALRGRPFVIYFYPQDETPGCIAEACGYRDDWASFEALGVPVLGVSRDGDESHRAFAAHRRLPFALVADPDGALHAAFGAFLLAGLPRRVSYLAGPDGRIAAVYDSHLQPGSHSARMLEAARRLGGEGAPRG